MALVGGLLVGVTLGSYRVLSLTYAMEVVPPRLSGLAGGIFSIGIILDLFLASAALLGVVSIEAEWAYRMDLLCSGYGYWF